MMRGRGVLLFWLMMTVWTVASAQCVNSSEYVEPSDKVPPDPEVMPIYPGGEEALVASADDKVIPKLMRADSILMRTMMVNFIIDKKGRCKDLKMYRSRGPRFDRIIIEEVKHMKRWMPGMLVGRSVSMRYCVRIRMKMKRTQRVKGVEKP